MTDEKALEVYKSLIQHMLANGGFKTIEAFQQAWLSYGILESAVVKKNNLINS